MAWATRQMLRTVHATIIPILQAQVSAIPCARPSQAATVAITTTTHHQDQEAQLLPGLIRPAVPDRPEGLPVVVHIVVVEAVVEVLAADPDADKSAYRK